MTAPSPSALMEAAGECARLAGAVALRAFRPGIAVDWKADGSPVTEADRAAERAAREWLEARFPEDGIVGEEFGERPSRSGRAWLLDPVDGTRSFVHGVPLWGTLVVLTQGERVLAGAASFPPVQEHLHAAPGEGCWHNGSRCRVSAVNDLSRATVLASEIGIPDPVRRRAWERLSLAAATARTWGDCFGYLLVATGRAEAMVDARMNAWDSAPLLPIIVEAGGRFTDWDGLETGFGGSVIATNLALADRVRTVLHSG